MALEVKGRVHTKPTFRMHTLLVWHGLRTNVALCKCLGHGLGCAGGVGLAPEANLGVHS